MNHIPRPYRRQDAYRFLPKRLKASCTCNIVKDAPDIKIYKKEKRNLKYYIKNYGQFITGIGIIAITIALWWVANKQTNISQESMQITNRAYFAIYEFIPEKITDLPSKFEISIKFINTGQTPAYKVDTWSKFGVERVLPDTAMTTADPNKSEMVIGQKGTFSITHDLILSNKQIKFIKTGKAFLYLVGVITYRDVFKNHQFLRYNAVYNTKTGHFTYRKKHNTAS